MADNKNDDAGLTAAYERLVRDPDAYFKQVRADAIKQVEREIRTSNGKMMGGSLRPLRGH